MKKFLIYCLFLANIAVVSYFWWQSSGSLINSGSGASIGVAISRLAGLIATQLALTQLILIGRIKWVESVFGLDKLSRVHKWNGYTILGLVVLHVFIQLQTFASLNEISILEQLFAYIKVDDDFLKAVLAFCILIGTVFLSVTIVRKQLKYEWWYWVHLFNYFTFILFVSHQLKFGSSIQDPFFQYYWIATYVFTALHIAWFRFGKPTLNLLTQDFTVSRVEDLGSATSVYISGKNLENFKRSSGQFMIFRFLQKGFWYEAHPFSLSWGANNSQIRFTAKKLGDFTHKLPLLQTGTKVLIDGPHGVFTSQKITKNKVVLIAGGIGITPLRSLTEELAGTMDLTLLYSARTKADAVLLNELKEIQAKKPFKLTEIYADERIAGAEYGRLDKDMLARLVPDVTERDVFLCGPPPMMMAIRTILKQLKLPNKQLHWERFAL